MKKKSLYIGIIICAMVVIAIYSVSLCGDDKDFRVVEIGEIDGVPISGPMKWAPSSDRIAFISKSNLLVVDTLGKKIAEFTPEFTPRRFEWLSDKEIVYFERLMSKSIAQIRLIRCDITTGQSLIIEEYKKEKTITPGLDEGYFEGPYLTVQGNLYYFMYSDNKKIPTFPNSQYYGKSKSQNNYIYKIHQRGLYLVRADQQDSIYAFDKNYADTVQSFEQKYYVRGGFVINLKDSSSVLLDTFPVLKSIKQLCLGCGFMNEDINPALKELIFNYGCDIDEDSSTEYIFLFDLSSNTIVNLAEKVNEDCCQVARFSPDGQKIAMCCTGKGYIIIREE